MVSAYEFSLHLLFLSVMPPHEKNGFALKYFDPFFTNPKPE